MKYCLNKGLESAKKSLAGIKNQVLRKTDGFLKPRWLWLEVTDRCNSRCKFCNIWQKKPTQNPLSPFEIKKIFSDKLFKNLKGVTLSGGEPTLRKDLEEIILNIHQTLPNTEIMFGTNGFLPEQVISIVKSVIGKHGINLCIGISLDGIWEDHDLIRGVKGSFKKVDSLIRQLVKLREKYQNKLGISAGFVLTDLTLPFIKKTKTYCEKLKIDLNIQWYAESSYYANLGKKLLSVNNKSLTKAVRSLPLTYLNERKLKLLSGESIKFPCFALYTFCLIKCNGDIVPCFNFWDHKIGNVRNDSLEKIWKSKKATKLREIVKRCPGCLNDCAILWSFYSAYYPILSFYLRHPRLLRKKNKHE